MRANSLVPRSLVAKQARPVRVAVAVVLVAVLFGGTLASATQQATAQGQLNRSTSGDLDMAALVPGLLLPDGSARSTAPAASAALVDSYWRAQAVAFLATDQSTGFHVDGSVEGCIVGNIPASPFVIAVNLPAGSVIKRLDVYYRNRAGYGEQGRLELGGADGLGGASTLVQVYARPGTETGSGYFTDSSSTVTFNVDNASYAYQLNWWPGGLGQSFCGARIYYQGPAGFGSLMPVVMRNQ